jgi:hypothetical protein
VHDHALYDWIHLLPLVRNLNYWERVI